MEFSFLISTERSGSNLITKILDAHPNICGPAPTHLFRIYAFNESKYGDLTQHENQQLLLEDTLRVFESQFGTWASHFSSQEFIGLKDKHKALSVLSYMYEKEAKENNAKKVFVKELYTYRFVDYLLSYFPTAKFIYLVRDPRDVALSFKKSPSHQKNVVEAIRIWLNDQRASIQVLERLGKQIVLLVKYEDLVQKPVQTATILAEFLGEAYNEQMLRFYETPLTQDNAKRMAAWKNLDQPIITTNCNKFQQELTYNEVLYIETLAQQEMRYFGYTTLTSADGDVNQLEKELNVPVVGVDVLPMSAQEKKIRAERAAAIQTIINRSL